MAQTTYQLVLSTDGKHTVIVNTDDAGKIKAAFEWAGAAYDRVVKRYGLKNEQRHSNGKAAAAVAEVTAVPQCAVHHVPMVSVNGKRGQFWSCHERDSEGKFCSYRPGR
jgi:hypothetical protein